MPHAKPCFKFWPGAIVTTRGALELDSEDVVTSLQRHLSGDWGFVDDEDWKANDHAVEYGYRILSVYRDRHGVKFWIITEWDRSKTTILLPDEY